MSVNDIKQGTKNGKKIRDIDFSEEETWNFSNLVHLHLIMKSDFFFLSHFEQLYIFSSVTLKRVRVTIYNFKESRKKVLTSVKEHD